MVRARLRGPNTKLLARWGAALLLEAGLACLALFLRYEWEASYGQASLSRAFDQERSAQQGGVRWDSRFQQEPFRGALSREQMPATIGRLEIPRIGLKVMVLNGADPSALRRGAGWLPETGQPGAGNAVIAAHRDTHFRPLRQIRKGDLIRMTTLDARYNYRVEWAAVLDPTNTGVLEPTSKPALTLITCYPFYYVGNAPKRFIVRAARQDSP